jgi:hypothetical protein
VTTGPASPPSAIREHARAALGVVCVVATAVLGALILGEYDFKGSLPFVAGPLFGLVLGEVGVSAGKTRAVAVAAIAAVCGFGAIVWAGWINSGEGLEPIHRMIWPSAALAGIFAYLRIAGLKRAPTGADEDR